MKVIVLVLVAFVLFALASCTSGGAVFQFYVVLEPNEAGRFIGAVESIAKEDGLETAVGQVTSDTGNVLRVVEGRGRGLKLWVQSATLSGDEDPKLCGVHQEPYPDPAQFVVFTEPRFLGTREAAVELGEKVFFRLEEFGFDVRWEPVVCGNAVIHRH
jgi:hypothetical protein